MRQRFEPDRREASRVGLERHFMDVLFRILALDKHRFVIEDFEFAAVG